MKKSTTRRLLLLCLCLTLVTVSLIGGTLAKYTTTVTGSATATVAKWAVKAGDSSGATTFTSNVYLEMATNDSGVADNKIAPGTSGKLPVYVDLTGTEVAAKVTVNVKVDDPTKLPSNFVIKNEAGTAFTPATTDTAVFTAELTAAQAVSYTKNFDVAWEWAFNGDNTTESAEDTNNGINPGTAVFTITVVIEQLDTDPAANNG